MFGIPSISARLHSGFCLDQNIHTWLLCLDKDLRHPIQGQCVIRPLCAVGKFFYHNFLVLRKCPPRILNIPSQTFQQGADILVPALRLIVCIFVVVIVRLVFPVFVHELI